MAKLPPALAAHLQDPAGKDAGCLLLTCALLMLDQAKAP